MTNAIYVTTGTAANFVIDLSRAASTTGLTVTTNSAGVVSLLPDDRPIAKSKCEQKPPTITFDPSATFRDAGMRPELVAALARQTEQPQPTSKECPDCKGAGTQLLTSACPTCNGSRRIPVASEQSYTYELRETFRDGDQVWTIKYGSDLDCFVLTALRSAVEAPHTGALATEVYLCLRSGALLTNRSKPQPGSFIGEHHGERAVAGYVEHLNRSAGR